jgi:hypothetical protein
MLKKPAYLFILLITACPFNAQETVMRTKYRTWDLHALRYYPFTSSADSFICRFIEGIEHENVDLYRNTSLDLIINKKYLENLTVNNRPLENTALRLLFKYYGNWLVHAHPTDINRQEIDLSLFFSETHCDSTGTESIFTFVEERELMYFLDEWTGDADFTKKCNEIMSSRYKNPLHKDAIKTYSYFFSGEAVVDTVPSLEIAFFSRNPEESAFEGYIYISKKDNSFVKAVFTVNYLNKDKILNSVLFTRTPSFEEDYFYFGNDATAGLVIRKKRAGSSSDIPRRSASQQELPATVDYAKQYLPYKNLQRAGLFMLNHKLNIAGNKFEIGPLTHTFSVNDMEGARLRFGANTTEILNSFLQAGGYAAYGMKDREWKFRGDMTLSFSHSDRLNMSIVRDLNIPGHNIFDDNRDIIYKSIKPEGGDYMTLQKTVYAGFEKSVSGVLAFNISARHTYDEHRGLMPYIIVDPMSGGGQQINSITTFETGISVRLAPGEKYIRLRGNRYVFRRADFDVMLNHRIGIKGVAGSGYSYRITDFSAGHRIILPMKSGFIDAGLSGGKVWDKVPFPLLFIPTGRQSRFVYEPDDYNLLHLYEYVSDRFIAGKINLTLNFSPIKLFYSSSTIQTNIGLKALYGSISRGNNPATSNNLFDFRGIISPAGDNPYLEGNIGLGNILHLFRLDYVYRFGNYHRNAVMVSVKLPM